MTLHDIFMDIKAWAFFSWMVGLAVWALPVAGWADQGSTYAWKDTRMIWSAVHFNEPEYAADKLTEICAAYDAGMGGWPDDYYTPGVPTVYPVHTGVIVEALLRWYEFVNGSPTWPQYQTLCQTIRATAEQAIPACATVIPGTSVWNEQTAMGLAYLRLATVTGRAEYTTMATTVATRLQAAITTAGNGTVWWPYDPAVPATPDDWSHAYITAQFLVRCQRRGIVFVQADTDALLLTLNTYYTVPHPTTNMNGTGAVSTWAWTQLFRAWMLAEME